MGGARRCLHGGGKLQQLIIFQDGAAAFHRLLVQQRRLVGQQHMQNTGRLVAGGQHRGAVFPHNMHTDKILPGQPVYFGVEVFIVDAGGNFFGGIFDGAGFDGFVEAFQKD